MLNSVLEKCTASIFSVGLLTSIYLPLVHSELLFLSISLVLWKTPLRGQISFTGLITPIGSIRDQVLVLPLSISEPHILGLLFYPKDWGNMFL
jgi:hypothetical protein